MYTEFVVGDKVYKLRLTTLSLINIEKALGYNPVQLFIKMKMDEIPKLKDLLIILQGMLEPLQHGTTFEKTCEIFDKYTESGNTQFDLIPLFLQVFTDAGFLRDEEEEEEVKNA
jgi:hypothetical protein